MRCPLAASGRLDAGRCRGGDLPVLAGGTAAQVACHFPGVPAAHVTPG